LLSYPIYQGFAVYGQAGVGGTFVYHSHTESNANNNNSDGSIKVEPQFGGGLEYTFEKHFTVSAGYNWTRMTIQVNNADHNFNINYYNVGLTYTF
jgi:opacity protein-like surface antigen